MWFVKPISMPDDNPTWRTTQAELQKHLVQMQSHRCSGAVLAQSRMLESALYSRTLSFSLSDRVCISTHSCGLIHYSTVFSRHNLMMSSLHRHGLRYTATRHIHTLLIWQQKQRCLLGHSRQRESLKGKPATLSYGCLWEHLSVLS